MCVCKYADDFLRIKVMRGRNINVDELSKFEIVEHFEYQERIY